MPRSTRGSAMSERSAAGGSRLLAGGLVLLGLLALACTLGAGLWRIDPDRQLDPARGGLRPPGSRLVVLHLRDGRDLAGVAVEPTSDGGLRLLAERSPVELPAAALAVGDPVGQRRFWLGSDEFGRDLVARLLAGGRVSLGVALLSVALILALGVPLGAAAGLAPAGLDRLLLRLIEAAQAFPRLPLLLALAAVAPPGLASTVLLLGLTGWMPMARLARGEFRALREREFVLAARVAGVGPLRIAWRHLLPNALAPLLVEASLAAASAIVSEAALSFLGFGVQPPTASWGAMIADGRDRLADGWWLVLFPGLALVAATLAFNLVGEGLRDRLDPRRRRLPA